MNISLAFVRTFFTLLCMLFVTIYSVHTYHTTSATFFGLLVGFCFGLFLIVLDVLFKRFNLRSFNISLLGLFFGYLMGQALVLILHAILKISITGAAALNSPFVEIVEIGIFLFGIYMGLILTLRASDELYASIPFVKFSPLKQKKKDLIIDTSALSDTRIIDLALSGLLDQHLVIPRFVVRDLYAQTESNDESLKVKARRSLDSLKKLEEYTQLGIRYNDTDFPEVKDQHSKLIRLGRLLDGNIITADISRVETSTIEGVKIINLHTLSNALKPISQTGEVIFIKVQRAGKEPNQGVGYLEDGTMVVVNGGGDYIGKDISVNVLSVKHTASGRMIFCNVASDDDSPEES